MGQGVQEHPPRWILHVDMDAFYASVEVRDDPSLAGRPVIVGGTGGRGVVASCSYEARVFGVRSAMPTSHARRLCPQAVFLAGRFGRYAEVSREMHAIFHRYTPLVEGISLDEAFLDVTGSLRLFGPAGRIGVGIREAVSGELGLSCSVGAATVKFLAKLASEAAKPKVDGSGRTGGPGVFAPGVFVIAPGTELEFLHSLPIEALWGVGPATARRLRQLGMATVRDLSLVPSSVVESVVGKAVGAHLARLARGQDDRDVEPHREVKSISHEETYPVDRFDLEGLRTEVIRMADSVATRLRQSGLAGRTVTLKFRYGDFVTKTRSVTAPTALDTAATIAEISAGLLAGIDLGTGLRLLGVGVSNLSPVGQGPGEQLSLDLGGQDVEAGSPGRVAVDAREASTSAAIDAIRERFGAAAVGPAALLSSAGLRVKRPGDTQWGPPAPPDRPAHR